MKTHNWTKASGRRNWACSCGAAKMVRSVRFGSWGATGSSDQTFFANADQKARGVWVKAPPPCTNTKETQ